jgi:copper chaperone CopZ
MRFLRCCSAVCTAISEAKVSLEKNEAVVTYDPDVVKVEDLIKAVKSARGMNSYDAKIKKK